MNTSIETRPRSIVLIDDERSVLFALKLLLEALGYQVTDFSSPLEALEHIKGGAQIDLCLCDLRMPGLTGLELLAKLRSLERPLPPFVLMSGHASEEEMSKARELGANGILSKPFTPEELEALMGRLFNANQGPR